MIISKSFEFDAAHRLNLPYESKCTNIHGHRYKVIVYIEGRVGNNGMVIDFSKLKEVVTKKIIDVFDHKTILDDNMQNFELIETIKRNCGDESIVLLPFNPTAENFSMMFYGKLKIDFGALLHKVEVYETPTSWSCYP